MANAAGVIEMSATGGAVALAELDDSPRSLWLAALPTLRQAHVGDLLPQLINRAELAPINAPVPAVTVVGTVPAAHGPISDLALSSDGQTLVATHYSADVVSVIDATTLAVMANTDGVSEPYAVTVTDRAYVSAASISDDAVVAVDIGTGVPLAATLIDDSAGGLAVSPNGEVIYVARNGDDFAKIAVIDIESGHADVIDVSDAPGASIDAMRISADGSRLFVALTSGAGSALAVVDTKVRAVAHTIPVYGAIADIAAHPNGRTVYATGWDADLGGVIQVIDTVGARVIDTVGVGGLPTHAIVAGRGDALYFIDGEDIVVFSTITNEVVDCVIMGRQLSCLAANGDGTRMYAADYEGGITALRLGALDSDIDVTPADLLQLEMAAR